MRILRGLSSRFLPCGCLAGVYETYDERLSRHSDCQPTRAEIKTHRNGKMIPVDHVSFRAGYGSPTIPSARA